MSGVAVQPDRAAILEFVQDVERRGGTYHRIDLGDGVATRGEYDMARYLSHYNLPPRLDGLTVLDVGTSSGYFALECARRGGIVTAIDLWPVGRTLASASRILGLDIRYVQKSIYDLEPALGEFDLVVCGSLLLHVADPLGAIRRLRAVCRGRTVVATMCGADSASNPQALCEFLGHRATDGDYWTYWSINAAALRRMLLAAGFAAIEHEDHFVLRSEPGGKGFVVPHVVMTASV